MSIAGGAIGEVPISAASVAGSSATKSPPKRRITAKADIVQQPEPR